VTGERASHAHAAAGDFAGAPAEVLAWLRREPGGSRVFVEATGIYSMRAADKLGMMNGVFALPDYEPSMPQAYLDYFRPSAAEPWHRLHLVPGERSERRHHPVANRLLDASCAARCLAVLTDLDYPGWQASVDGRAAEIVATHGIFRGVSLEAGAHERVYRFAPASLRAGLALFAAALAALAAGALRAWRGRRRGP